MNARDFFAMCLALAPTLAGADIYQCKGEDGVVQFRDRPCRDTSSSFKPLSAPDGNASHDQRLERMHKLLRAYKVERSQQRDQQAAEQAEKAERQRRCVHARDRLRSITEAGSLYRTDKGGNRTLLSDEERERAADQARQKIAEVCD